MLSHHLAFQIGPPIMRDLQLINTNMKEALIGNRHFPIGHLESRCPLTDLGAGRINGQTCLLQKLTTCGAFVAFAGFQSPTRCRPKDLAGERPGPVFEFGKEDAFLAIDDEQTR